MLGAANRDENRYPDPDRFDIFRAPKPPLSVGHGVHVCRGMHLARLEMRVALELLLDRLPDRGLIPRRIRTSAAGLSLTTSLPVLFGAAPR
jgi:cytochrome P450